MPGDKSAPQSAKPARRSRPEAYGGANWAIIASLIETCKLNGLNPHAWLTDTLTKLVNRWPASRIDELMPWDYAKLDPCTVKV